MRGDPCLVVQDDLPAGDGGRTHDIDGLPGDLPRDDDDRDFHPDGLAAFAAHSNLDGHPVELGGRRLDVQEPVDRVQRANPSGDERCHRLRRGLEGGGAVGDVGEVDRRRDDGARLATQMDEDTRKHAQNRIALEDWAVPGAIPLCGNRPCRDARPEVSDYERPDLSVNSGAGSASTTRE